MNLYQNVITLSLIDTFSDTRKIGGDDTLRDYRVIFGVANNYLFECILKFIKYKSFSISEQFPGFVKFQIKRDFGIARFPRTGTVLKDYKDFKEEIYSYINEHYDADLFTQSEETLFEHSLYYKLYQQYFDKYQVALVEPSSTDFFSPQIKYKFKIYDRTTKKLINEAQLSVKQNIQQFKAGEYYFNLHLLEAYKNGIIKV